VDGIWLLLIVPALLGFYMAWNIGANDVANSMAAAVGSRSLTVRNAVIAAAICEFLGAVLVGAHVTDTIRKGIVRPTAVGIAANETPSEQAADPATTASAESPAADTTATNGQPKQLSPEAFKLAVGMSCSLLAAAIWLHMASSFGMPVSTTHSIVGAVTGFGVIAFGVEAINWPKMGEIVASWFISPILGCVIAFVLFKLILATVLGRQAPTRAAIRYAPFLVFIVGFVMALSILWKGLKHLLQEQQNTLPNWMTGNNSDSAAIYISVAIGALSFVAAYGFLRYKLAGRSAEPLSEQLEQVERMFAPLVVITSCCVAFSHGANDVANSVGPLAAVVDIVSTGDVQSKVPVPLWVLTMGGIGIVIGLSTYGYKVMSTVGEKITQLTPSRGIAANTAATIVVLACSRMGLPVSTTHTLVGSILGVGLARGLASVDRSVTRDIFGGWLITVPIAAIMSAVLYLIAITVLG
jgi:PiT family inorganic phosphate transporter